MVCSRKEETLPPGLLRKGGRVAKWKELGVGVMATYQLPELKHRPPHPQGL